MMTPRDNQLDQLLQTLEIPDPSSNLAARIISSAKPHIARAREVTILDIISELLLPKPAFALCLTLFIGYMSSEQLPIFAELPQTQESYGDFLYNEGETL